MVSLAGKTLGKYRLIEQLGRGGFASVYKAYQARLDRYVAIKVLHPHLVEGEDFLARFEREAKAVAGLRHPHIVIVHDFDVHENTYYMVMEYIDGESLKQRLDELNTFGQHLSLAEVNRIMADITSALDYAHHQGMLHRDIKPSNVILNKLGDAFLTDFGIARILSNSQFTATGALIGTPAYMSPEQGQGLSVSPASDVYSLGIMLYEFLTGRVPYDADTPLAIIFKHIRDPLPSIHTIRPDLPADLEKVMYKALAKDPEDRYQSPGEMRQALQEALMKDLQAETQLSVPSQSTIHPSPAVEESDREAPEIQPLTKPAADMDKAEPPTEGVVPEFGVEETVPEPEVVSHPPILAEATEVATVAINAGDGKIPASEGKVDEQEELVAEILKKVSFPTKRWIIGGIALVGIIMIGFLLFSLFRPQAGVVPTEVALAATATLKLTQRPTAPPQPTEIPGLMQFEAGLVLLNEERDFLAAIDQFKQAEVLGFESAELFAHRARACYESQLFEERCSFEDAIRDYTRAIEIDPQMAWYFDGRCWAYAELKEWPLAIEDISRAIEIEPHNPDYWINRGEISVQVENWDQAMADFNHAIELRPDHPRSYDARGTALSILGDLESAIRDFTTAIELDLQNPGYYVRRARAFARLEDLEAAIHDLDTAIHLAPDADHLYIEKAHVLCGKPCDHQAALEALDRAIALNPYNWEAFTNRGEIFAYELGNPELALENFNQSISVAPRGLDSPFFNRGVYFISIENWVAAIEDLNMVIHISPERPDGYGHRGNAYRQLGDLDAARTDFQIFLELTQEKPEYVDWRVEIETWLAQNP